MTGAALFVPVLAGVLGATWKRGGASVSAVLLGLTALAVGFAATLTHAWADEYGALALTLGAVAYWVSPNYLLGASRMHPWSGRRQSWYYLLLGLFIASLVALGQHWPLLTLWVAIEATTIISVGLVAMNPGPKPFEAAWKYLVLASLGGLLALAGILVGHLPGARDATLAVALLIVGLGTKAGLVPFHFWLPDAHAEAPAPVSGLLSGAELAGVLFILREALTRLAPRIPGHVSWPYAVLLGLGLLSMAVGTGLIPLQTNLKRLFAYSSVEHMGLVAVGIAFGGIALLGALLHVFTHGLAKSQAFYLTGRVQGHYRSTEIRDIGRVHQEMPVTGAGLLVAVAALAGIPPFGPFWSEWLVIMGGLSHPGTFWPAVATALLLAIGLLSLARRVPGLWHRPIRRNGVLTHPEDVAAGASAAVMSVLTLSAGLLVPWIYALH